MGSRSRRCRPTGTAGVALVVSLTLTAAACSIGGENEEETSSASEMPEVRAVVARSEGAWGSGRAVAVRTAGDGSAVATTSGLYVADDDETAPRQIRAFDSPTRVTAMSVVDDTTMIVASDPPVVERYDLVTGEQVGRLELPIGNQVLALGGQPDGAVLIETSSGPMLWADPLDVTATALTAGQTGRGAFTGDGAFVAPVTGTSDVVVVDGASSGRFALDIPAEATVLDARAAPGGDLVAVTAGIGSNPIDRRDQIVLLDSGTWSSLGRIETEIALNPAAWTVTDSAVVVGDGVSIAAWTFEGESQTAEPLDGVDAAVSQLVAVADGVISVHEDGTVVRWSEDSWTPTTVAPGGVTIQEVFVSDEGRVVTTVDFFGRITRHDLDAGDVSVDDRFGAGRPTAITATGSGDRLAASFDSGRVVVLDTSLAEQQWIPAADRSTIVDTVRFEPSGTALVTGVAERTGELAFDDTVTVWDPSSDSPKYTIGGESEDVVGCSSFTARVDFASGGESMAVASHDFSVSIVDLDTGAIEHHLPTDSGTVLDLAYTSDGGHLVASTEGGEVRTWDASDFSVAADLVGPMGGYQAIAMLPDGATMAAVELTGAVSLVDVLSGEVRRQFAEPAERTAALAVSDDGALVAAPGSGATVSIWSTQSGQQLASLDGFTGTVVDLTFVNGTEQLVAASDGGTIHSWTIERQL